MMPRPHPETDENLAPFPRIDKGASPLVPSYCFFSVSSVTSVANLMYRKFYKLLIIGNPKATILHIPNRNNGMME
jgi:hypothetical protein